MTAPSFADYRAQVEKELRGAAYETLTQKTPEGLPIAPLYVEAPPEEALVRDARALPFRVCMRHGLEATPEAIAEDLDGGADALWLPFGDAALGALDRTERGRVAFVLEPARGGAAEAVVRLAARAGFTGAGLALLEDPLGRLAAGLAPAAELGADLTAMAAAARAAGDALPDATSVMVSTLPYHDAGADAAEELALALSTGVAYLEALIAGGASPAWAGDRVAFQLAVGRETSTALCKLRALRPCWPQAIAASGADGAKRTLLHAVSSSRTLAQRDPG